MSEKVVNQEHVHLVENTKTVDEELKKLLKEKALVLLKDKLNVETLNSELIIKFVVMVMELVEDTEIKGKSQKDLVLQIVTEIINESQLSDEEKKLYFTILNSNNTSNTIDIIVDASKGNLNLNKVKKTAFSCLLSCLKN
tara:strand:+ start:1273 stop:1692 length:420 start_codon:yes stop_codon:yes gene_type:complete